MPAFVERRSKDLGIGGDKIDRRDHIEQLSRHESDHLLMMRRDAADPGHGIVPPLLIQKKSLVDRLERQTLPPLASEPMILLQRLETGRTGRVGGKV
ncbi:MAG TPA: hypothetical protein VE687_09315 [Stellaceae bacterium]|nr:hypothetical protein [Stellaceae bacterium]